MEEEKDDKLDNFFRSRLNSDGEDSNWNLPPESVLTNAFDKLDKKEKRKRRGWLFWLVGLGLLGIMSFLAMSYNQKLSQLENEIVQLKREKQNEKVVTDEDHIGENGKKEKGDIEEVQIENTGSEVKGDVSIRNYEQKRMTNQRIRRTFKTLNETVVLSDLERKLLESSEGKDEVDIKWSKEVLNKEPIPIFSDTNKVKKTELKIVMADLSLEKENTLDEDSIVKSDTAIVNSAVHHAIKSPPTSNYLLAIYFGLNSTNLTMTSDVTLPNNLTEYDNNYIGYQMGARIQRNLFKNKIYLQGEVGYAQVRNNSVFVNEEKYDKNNETINSLGKKTYSTVYGFESPVGSFSELVEFGTEGMDLDQNDKLTSTMDMKTKFRIWNVYLGGMYTFYEIKRFSANVNLGLQANYVSELSQEMDYNLGKDNISLSQESYSLNSLPTMNHQFLSVKFGAGVTYSKGALIYGLTGNYHRSIQSIREPQSPANVKTQLNQFQTNLSVGFLF